MTELGGNEWDDREEVEISGRRDPDLDSFLEQWQSYKSEVVDVDADILDPEEGDEGFGELLDGDQPGQETSNDWDELARELRDALETTRDTPFTRDEQEMVRSALHDAQEEITRLMRVNDQQLALIKSLSEQLSRSSERIGRKDWLIMGIGAGTALVIAGFVPSAVMLPIGVKFFHAIAHLFD
jgi:hypothetical protein